MILESLTKLYDRLAAAGDVPQFGFSKEGISFAIVITRDGRVTGIESIRTLVNGKPRSATMYVPQPVVRRMNVSSNFLWDNSAYLFGITGSKTTGEPVPVKRGEHETFKRFHREMLADTQDPELQAVLEYCKRWKPVNYDGLAADPAILTTNIGFKLEGSPAGAMIHQVPEAREKWERHLADTHGTPGPCLATGMTNEPVARLHPSFKAIPGAPATGAALVSFNERAFESQGHKQGENAPVSETAAFKYGTALKLLLNHESEHRIRIRDATIVYWADGEASPDAARAAETMTSRLLQPPARESDEVEETRELIRELLEKGEISKAPSGYDDTTPVHVLVLYGNRGRLGVRFQTALPIGELALNVANHWNDLHLAEEPLKRGIPMWRLIGETAPAKQPKNTLPNLPGQLAAAILSGTAYPVTLSQQILTRFRNDRTMTPLRIAALKAALRRTERLNPNNPKEDHLVTLDTTTTNTAYLLGRLLAVFAYAEKAVAKRQGPLTSQWMPTASSAPRRAFGTLMKAFRNNITRLGSGDGRNRRSQIRADRVAGEIIALIPAPGDLPMFLTTDDQTRFFIGYYHQDKALYTKAETAETPTNEENDQ